MCLQKSFAESRQDTHQIHYQPSDMVGNHGAWRNPHRQHEQDTALFGCYSSTYKQTPNSRGHAPAGLISLELAAIIRLATLQNSFRTSDISTICGRWSWVLEYASISVTTANVPLGLFT